MYSKVRRTDCNSSHLYADIEQIDKFQVEQKCFYKNIFFFIHSHFHNLCLPIPTFKYYFFSKMTKSAINST